MSGLVVIDGSGERYEVVGYSAMFTLKSLDRPDARPLLIDSVTLKELGVEWDGRTLNPVGGVRKEAAA